MSDDETLLTVARSVANGEPVDWSAVERDARGDEVAVVRELQHLESILAAHRKALAGNGGESQDNALRSWGSLEVLEKIGEGSFGEVFRARDPRLERDVALKLRRAPEPGMSDGAAGVIEEARLLSRVRHPGVAIIHGADRHEGRVGLWMEFLRGRTLEELLRAHGVFGAREAGAIGVELCQALAAVHRAGLLHLDVKSQNVMREEGGRIVLMDFGAGAALTQMRDEDDPAVSGTPLYMAPEVLRGEPPAVQSDVYGLGVLLFHLVTGSYPVKAASLRELREAHAGGAAQILGELRPDLPPGFVRVVERALAASPQDRFAGAAAMGQALAAALGLESVSLGADTGPARGGLHEGRRGRLLLVLAAVALLSAAVIGWIAWRGRLDPRTTTPDQLAARALPDPKRDVGSSPSTPGEPAAVAADYTVEASFYRGVGARQRLAQGDIVRIGDALSMEFRASRPLHVYVVNEDEKGTAVLLFPLSGGGEANPLSPDLTHHLPGPLDGATRYWQVTSAGGREHLLIVASPDPVVDLEREALSMERPRPGEPLRYPRLSDGSLLRLRGVTGMITAPAPRRTGTTARLFDLAGRLESGGPETVGGVWARRLELENPGP